MAINKKLQKELLEEKSKLVDSMTAVVESMLEEKKQQSYYIKKNIEKNGRKKFILDSVIAYRAYYNDEYTKFLQQVYRKRKTAQAFKNEQAIDKTGEFQNVFDMPSRLICYLNRYLDPDFPCNNKELKWFFKNFPEFRIAKI